MQKENPVVTQEPTRSLEEMQSVRPVDTQEPTGHLENMQDQEQELTATQEPVSPPEAVQD